MKRKIFVILALVFLMFEVSFYVGKNMLVDVNDKTANKQKDTNQIQSLLKITDRRNAKYRMRGILSRAEMGW